MCVFVGIENHSLCYEPSCGLRAGRDRVIVITQLRDTLAWLERAERTGAPLFTTNIGLVESGKRWVKKSHLSRTTTPRTTHRTNGTHQARTNAHTRSCMPPRHDKSYDYVSCAYVDSLSHAPRKPRFASLPLRCQGLSRFAACCPGCCLGGPALLVCAANRGRRRGL